MRTQKQKYLKLEIRLYWLPNKLKMPKIKTWAEATKPFREAAEKSGFTKTDLDLIIKEIRNSK